MDQIENNQQTEHKPPIEECIMQILCQLGIEQAHFAGCHFDDWQGLAVKYPEVILSLSLICPPELNIDPLRNMASRVLIVVGEESLDTKILAKAQALLAEASFYILRDFRGDTWDDPVAERKDEVGPVLIDFTNRTNLEQGVKSVSLEVYTDETDGISYAVQGVGPPLILLPLELAPSQWQPLIPELSKYYCTITLTGPKLGIIPFLEKRGQSAGYVRMLNALMDAVQLRPGQSILELGCGSGVINRWLARQTGGANHIVGIDINDYLLKEAVELARKEGLDQAIEFRKGNAENLPFPDDAFDVTISSTVMEEVDADKMIDEMIRVTKPGGRVGNIVRANDMPWLYNVPLPAALKAKIENPVESFDESEGCASASLYRRYQRSGLTNIRMMPYLAVFDNPEGGLEEMMERSLLSRLNPEETAEWQSGKAKAIGERTFFFAWPHHCAVGTKPG
jgi:SAM-dependent methyltransferase